MTERVLPPVVIDPSGALTIVELSGEMVPIQEASDVALGRWLATYKDARELMAEAKREIDVEFVRRCDYNATQHLDIDGIGRVTVDGPGEEEVWDTNDLRSCLRKLVAEGEISELAARAALEKVTSWKVKALGIKNLRKLGGYVQQSIDACCDRQSPVRRARLTARASAPVKAPDA